MACKSLKIISNNSILACFLIVFLMLLEFISRAVRARWFSRLYNVRMLVGSLYYVCVIVWGGWRDRGIWDNLPSENGPGASLALIHFGF